VLTGKTVINMISNVACMLYFGDNSDAKFHQLWMEI
jgi:hypothetical protein